MPEFFTPPVKLQRTWMADRQITLAAKGEPHSLNELRTYQQLIHLGQKRRNLSDGIIPVAIAANKRLGSTTNGQRFPF